MHYRRITQIGLEEGLIVPGGATPEASLNSAVTQDIKKRAARGDAQRFRAHGRGRFSLARPSDPLRGAVEAKNREVRERLREVLEELHPKTFEELIGHLLAALGFEDVEVTRYAGDKGVDLRATLVLGGVTDVRTAIQVKRLTSSNVGAPTVRELRGGLGPHERGLIITLSKFSRGAHEEASQPDRSPISLIDGDELIELLVDNLVGVSSTSVAILEIDEGFFSDSAEDEAAESTGLSRTSPLVNSDRVLSLWPLPGGGAAWKTSLDSMLRHVASEAPTMAEAIDWLIESFERAESRKTARGYWQVLRSFGLIETQGEQVVATALGSDYLSDPTDEALLEIASDRILGVEEMLDWMRERPMAPDELLDQFNQSLGVEWASLAQITFRLGWLALLGAVEQRDGKWRAVGA
jgi:hypothetical protein